MSLAATACSAPDDQPEPQPNASATPEPSATPAPPGSADGPPPGYTDGSGINEGYPILRPADLTPEAARGEAGARDLLVTFARALELREYDQAWAMLGITARQDWTREQFNQAFAGLEGLTVAVPGGTLEGAAGSSFYESRIEVTASDPAGRPARIEGPIVLRRVNDVPGATPDQLRWHIERLQLDVTH
ncbi:hypothetical protein GRI99_15695 [Altererythrobacter buctensis]|uniref:Uncharacterized protein n=1 Tax=Alteraurantiacibacter buctensis TaxID=1503981 RepID=A0A844Z253_9SPHN|nr:hypothetical protein [Alteraurantiacibacter buctensis]